MTRASSLETIVLLLGMMLLAGLGALVLLGSAQVDTATTTWHAQPAAQQVTIDWLRPDQVQVPSGLTIAEHAAKHNGDTEKIYKLLLEGHCAEVAMYCGGSNIEKMYACVDPITGLVGIMLRFGDEIKTGYFSRNQNNLENRIAREKWRACDD